MALATSTVDAVTAAITRRADLRTRLHADHTDCYRLFHGIAEGEPGLTIDRYGTLLLAQTFRSPLTHDEADELGDVVRGATALDLPFCCNHRGELPPGFPTHEPPLPALDEHIAHEHGAAFVIRARHRGQDPWLFLDLRPARQRIRDLALGRAVLNLFAYTCGVGIVAALGGARSVLNIDFATSALAVGTHNAARNGIGSDRFQVLQSDCIPVLRQLAGLQREFSLQGMPEHVVVGRARGHRRPADAGQSEQARAPIEDAAGGAKSRQLDLKGSGQGQSRS